MNFFLQRTLILFRTVSYITLMFPLALYMFIMYKENYNPLGLFFNITPSSFVSILMIIEVLSITYFIYFTKIKIFKHDHNRYNTKVKEVKVEKEKQLMFLWFNLLPISILKLNSNKELYFIIFIVIILGIIYVKNSLIYINPLYYLLGFQVYKASVVFDNMREDEVYIISSTGIYEVPFKYLVFEGYDKVHFCKEKLKNRK